MTAKVSHHFIPVHRQKRVQRPRSLLHELVPLATCSHGRFRICTKGTCYRIQEVPGSNSALTVGPPAERGHHSCSPPPHPKKGADCQLPGSKNKGIFFPQKYLSLDQGCCWHWPLAREKLLGWGLGRSPGLKTECPWACSQGEQGAGGAGWQRARPPLEIRACFLILSFLCWPDQAARRGGGCSGWDQGAEQSKS